MTPLQPKDLARHWPAISALLDEALALPAAERAHWLESLPGEQLELKDSLRLMLAQQARIETGDLLETLPKMLADVDAGGGTEPAAGELVGPYRLIRELGQGGMGAVWLAERVDGQLTRQVALKLPRMAWGGAFAERLRRERDILATLAHPHIARLYDAGVDQHGRPYLAMEYIDGQAIDVYCQQRALPLRDRVGLLLQVAQAVAYAHAQLVVHRDLKPGNILVTPAGEVRLLDFGIAKLMADDRTSATALTELAGRALTLDYASPEQIRGEPLGTASDVYSLAVVAYELLSGARPYQLQRGSAAELEEAIAHADVPLASHATTDPQLRKELAGDIDAILHHALRKDAAQRYAGVETFAQDLQRHLDGQAVLARPDSRAYRARKFIWRHRVVVGAASAIALAIVAGAGAALWQAARATEQARMAQQQADIARRESRRAEAVQGFVLDIFRANSDQQDDPVKARNATARELLDRGAARLETDLKDAPEARVKVMETLGDMYYQLQLDEQAVAIEFKRVELLRELYGKSDRRVAEALIKLASSLHATGQRQRILPALEEARGILDALGEHDSLLRGELWSYLAQRHQNISLEKMKTYADDAVRVLRPLSTRGEDKLSTALHLAARARSQLGEYAQAEALYREAIVELDKLRPPSQLSLLQSRNTLAETLAAQQKLAEALQVYRQAVDAGLAGLGDKDVGVAVTQARLAGLMHATGQRTAGRALHEAALQRVLQIKGEADTLYTPIARMEFARSLFAEGQLAPALSLVEAVNASNRRHYAGSAVLGNGLRLQAAVLTAMGQTAQARELFAEGLGLWRKAGGNAMLAWRFNRFHLDEARLDLALDQAAGALARLQQIAMPPDAASMPLVPDAVERDILASRAQLMLGDTPAALALAAQAADRIAASPIRPLHGALETQVNEQLGQALLRAGRSDAACAAINAARAWREANDAPQSTWLAQARRARAQCPQAALHNVRAARS